MVILLAILCLLILEACFNGAGVGFLTLHIGSLRYVTFAPAELWRFRNFPVCSRVKKLEKCITPGRKKNYQFGTLKLGGFYPKFFENSIIFQFYPNFPYRHPGKHHQTWGCIRYSLWLDGWWNQPGFSRRVFEVTKWLHQLSNEQKNLDDEMFSLYSIEDEFLPSENGDYHKPL